MPSERTRATPPQQQRSREALRRVVAAGIEVLGTSGYADFTVQELSRRSGVSVGSMYARFADKDALYHAVQDAALAGLEAEHQRVFAGSRWDRMDPGTTILAAVRSVARITRSNPPLLRVMVQRAAVDPVAHARAAESVTDLNDHFCAVVLRHRDALRHPDPDVAVDLCFRMSYGAIMRRIVHGATFDSRRRMGWERFVDGQAELVAAALLGPPRADGSHGSPTMPA